MFGPVRPLNSILRHPVMSIASGESGKIPATGKVLAWLSIVVGILTALTPVMPIVPTQGPFSTLRLAYFVLLGLTSAVSGVNALRSSSRAFYVLWYVYAVQMFAYTSDSLSFNFMGPYSLAIGFGDYEPPSFVNINILAVVACFIALYNARFLAAAQSRVLPGVSGV